MRKLMWFSIGFCGACFLTAYWIPSVLGIVLGIPFLITGVSLFLFQGSQRTRAAALILLGLSLGQLWYGVYSLFRLSPVRALDGQEAAITLTAGDYSYDTDYGIAVEGTVKWNHQTYRVKLYLNEKKALSPGDRVSGTFRLRYTGPDAKEGMTHHSGNGILLLAYPKGEAAIIRAESGKLRYVPVYLRNYLINTIEAVFAEDVSPFAKALLLGDTSDLDYRTETALSASGLRHVVAVSGLHISILFSMVYYFVGKRRFGTALIGFPVLLIFAATVGSSPSILRSGIMQALMLLSLMFDREYDPPTALSFAALAMVAVNPLTITSVGFQLSVASVLGIFLFSGRIHGWLMHKNRLGRWNNKSRPGRMANRFSSSVSISISAVITTTPLTAWYFGTVSLISVLTNLLCLWVITYLFCGIIFTCVIATIWLPLGKIAAWVLAWLVRYILGVANLAAEIPYATVYTESVYIVAWLFLCYLLLAVFLLSKHKRPVVLFCCAVLCLCASLTASAMEPRLDDYRVTVLDVGQGQCVLLQSQGRTYMVDCGGSYDEETADIAAATLLSQGVTQLDGVILSHYDKDHVGAVGYLLQRVETNLLILPHTTDMENLDVAQLKPNVRQVIYADVDIQICWEDAVITIYSMGRGQSGNESSLCVLFHTEKCDILITGDRNMKGEEILLRTAVLPQLDALVVGHHGAASSTGDALLRATRPRVALISAGEGNRYGHPAQSVLDRLARYGCVIRRTDIEGTIIFRG